MRGGGDFVVNLVDGLTAPTQGIGSAWHVDVQRVADRFAHVQGFKQCQLFGVLLEQAGKADHHGFTFGWRQTGPGTRFEGRTRVFYSALGVCAIAAGDLAQQAAIDRAEALERFFGDRVGVFTVDEGATFDFQLLGTLFPVTTRQGGHSSVLLLIEIPTPARV
ncbi:MAG: Secreted protein [Pseudomonas helleri]